MFIYPKRVVGWRVVRTWPTLINKAFPKLNFEYLEVWRADASIYPHHIWHDGYHSGSHISYATIFQSYEKAVEVMKIVEKRWDKAVFAIEPLQV